jgi:hypothetical protein
MIYDVLIVCLTLGHSVGAVTLLLRIHLIGPSTAVNENEGKVRKDLEIIFFSFSRVIFGT